MNRSVVRAVLWALVGAAAVTVIFVLGPFASVPDIEPPAGGFGRLLAKLDRRVARLHTAELPAVPAGIFAAFVLVIWSIQARTSLDASAIDAEMHGRESVETSERDRYRLIKQPTTRSDVRVYAIETNQGRD